MTLAAPIKRGRGRPRKSEPPVLKLASSPLTKPLPASLAQIDHAAAIVTTLPYESIYPHTGNVRRTFDGSDIADLWQSISTLGLNERLIVRPHPNGRKNHYQLVDGERRYRAIGLSSSGHPLRKAVPVEIHDLTDDQVQAIMLVSREQSRDLLVSEKVAGFVEIAKNKTHDQIAAMLGEPVARVRSMLRLARLPEQALKAIDRGDLSFSTAELLARVGEGARPAAIACVLAGFRHYRIGDKLPTPQKGCEPLTFRQTKELINETFQSNLSRATFSRVALDLIPGVPACNDCPKRAGNDPDAIADRIREDMCLDPVCFGNKSKAHADKAIAAAKAAGTPFLSPSTAKQVFSSYGQCNLSYGSGYVDLHDLNYEDSKRRTYKECLGKKLTPDKVTVAVDPKGFARELIKGQDFQELTKTPKMAERETKAEAVYKEQQAKRKQETRIQRETDRKFLAAAWKSALELFKGLNNLDMRTLLQQLAEDQLKDAWAATLEDMAGWRGLQGKTQDLRNNLLKHLDTATSPELMAFIVEMLVARNSPRLWGGETSSKALQQALGISYKAIEKQVKADLSQPKGPKIRETKIDLVRASTMGIAAIEDFPAEAFKYYHGAGNKDAFYLDYILKAAATQPKIGDLRSMIAAAVRQQANVTAHVADLAADAILKHLEPGRNRSADVHTAPAIAAGTPHLNGSVAAVGS